MSEVLSLKIAGLNTNPNQYSAVSDGSLVIANNAVINRPGLADCRRGNKQYSELADISKLFKYKDTLLAFTTDTLWYDNAGTFTAYAGTFSQPAADYKMRGIQASSNFYFTTSAGIYKINSLTDTPKSAGIPPALDGTATLDGSAGFLDNNHGVAYRIVLGVKDPNNNLLLGAPSQRVIVYNTAGAARNVQLTFTLPAGLTTSYFYQIYRSYDVTSTSLVPADELFLVNEGNPSSADITAKSITVVDNTPFDLMGESLYTNATQQGIIKSNYPPPFCKDFDVYKNYCFFANTKQKQSYSLKVVAIGSPDGIQVDDTITIAGITYTAKAAENIAAAQFKVYTSGTLAENIEDTALSLCRVVNRYSSSVVYAYYMSGFEDLPGLIRFDERSIGGNSFALTSSRGDSYLPVLPVSGTTESSTAETRLNGLYFSKQNQPEHVPQTNYLLVGSADVAIDRIVALRDSLFIFKRDGIFRLSGDSPESFSVVMFDPTTSLISKDSAVAFNNAVYGWFDQGICAVADGGAQIISESINQELLELSSSNYPNFNQVTFGISYETDRKYIVYTNTSVNDTIATQAFVYNTLTNAWTKWTNSRTTGLIGSDDKLYCADASNVFVERKTHSKDDYADEEYDVTVAAMSYYDVTLSDASDCVVGYTLRQGNAFSIIEAIDGNIVTVKDNIVWSLGAAKVYKPIEFEIKFSPLHCGDPARMKHFQEIIFAFNNGLFNTTEGYFTSDVSYIEETVQLKGGLLAGWGQFPWGSLPWGVDTSKILNSRTYIPAEAAKAHHINIGLRLAESFINPMYMGFSLVFDWLSVNTQE